MDAVAARKPELKEELDKLANSHLQYLLAVYEMLPVDRAEEAKVGAEISLASVLRSLGDLHLKE